MGDSNQQEKLNKDKKKEVINELLTTLTKEDPSVYYLSAIDIADKIKQYIDDGESLEKEKYEQVKSLSKWDIQMYMSIH